MKKELKGTVLINYFENLFPPKFASEGDPIRLQLGMIAKPIKRVMIALEVTYPLIEEAIQKDVDLLIVHHPMIYKPLKNVSFDNPNGKKIHKLIKNDIAVYVAHTNLDVAKNGLNDFVANKLQLQNKKSMVPNLLDEYKKIGMGRVGKLEVPMSLEMFAKYVKEKLNIDTLRVVGDLNKEIKKVALLTGSGGSYLIDAKNAKADVYISGDLDYHVAQSALEIGLPLIDIGHAAESVITKTVAPALEQFIASHNYDCEIIESSTNFDPYTYI